jgi:hypothetical protein
VQIEERKLPMVPDKKVSGIKREHIGIRNRRDVKVAFRSFPLSKMMVVCHPHNLILSRNHELLIRLVFSSNPCDGFPDLVEFLWKAGLLQSFKLFLCEVGRAKVVTAIIAPVGELLIFGMQWRDNKCVVRGCVGFKAFKACIEEKRRTIIDLKQQKKKKKNNNTLLA